MNCTIVNYPPANFAMSARPLHAITDLIVHHTAGPVSQTPLDIDREHRAIGDAMIAYNYVITPNGCAYSGRPLSAVPAAAYGRNTESVNVVLVGNFQSDAPGFTGDPTPQQVAALKVLALQLHRTVPSICRTIGHRDVAPLFYGGDGDYATACPGDRLYALLTDVKRYVAGNLKMHA